MKLLTEAEFRATFTPPMSPPPDEDGIPFDFWPYFDAIPSADFRGYDCSAGVVNWVWRDASGHFEHVLFNSQAQNVFMVLVLDLRALKVHGHHLLDLNAERGREDPRSKTPGE